MKDKTKKALIVESPTKAKTISKLLHNFHIEATFGHVKDLPKGTLGVDVEHNFEPKYVVPKDKTKKINQMRKSLKGFDTYYLASDPDREGEAIACNIKEILQKDNPKLKETDFKRIVFHEITKEAINEALEKPMILNQKLLDAQKARRVLDRLVGYTLSPLLRDKIRKGLSAGRVQSVAVRLIVDREREIQNFKPEEYWEMEADFKTQKNELFRAKLAKKIEDEKKKNGKIVIHNKEEADEIINNLDNAHYTVSKFEQKEINKSAYPPFITSTLQQSAINLFGFSSKKTMQVAQSLFERGFITYMRTDSFNLNEQAVTKMRAYVADKYGEVYVPKFPNKYRSRSKVAQEAHEAIRPTDISNDIEKMSATLDKDELRLYDLIWKRTLASQMEKAVFEQKLYDIVTDNLKINYLFKASGSKLKFSGWKEVYGVEDEEEKENIIPDMKEKEEVTLKELLPAQKFTQPPARYTEASLIKALEENEIGRPSTYAPTISTILARNYVEKEEKKLKPTDIGFIVNDFLAEYFPDIINYAFTAEMEENLDAIVRGEKEWVPIIKNFFGPFNDKVTQVATVAKKIEIKEETTDEVCEKCGRPMVVKMGRFGKFLACSGFPECKSTKPLLLKIDVKCPKCGGDLVLKRTRKGRKFFGCSRYPECDFASWQKPQAEETKQQ